MSRMPKADESAATLVLSRKVAEEPGLPIPHGLVAVLLRTDEESLPGFSEAPVVRHHLHEGIHGIAAVGSESPRLLRRSFRLSHAAMA